MKWPLARVIEFLFGGDGVSRVAVLKTASGVTKRAVIKLCLLPLKDDVETQASNGGCMSVDAAAAAY